MLYSLLPIGRFLFQRQLADSPVCVFRKDAEETLLHMYWDCPKIQDYWFDVQGWLHTSFTHCTDIIFSKELVIHGSKANVVTDRILDLCILTAKYNVFISKLHGTIPHLNVFTRFLQSCSGEILLYVKYQTKQISCRLDAVQLTPFMSSSLLSGVFCFYSALLFSISIAN